MIETETTSAVKKKKAEPGTDWWGVAAQFGAIALQGLVAGAAGAVGGRLVNSIGAKDPLALSAGMDGKVLPIRKTGTV